MFWALFLFKILKGWDQKTMRDQARQIRHSFHFLWLVCFSLAASLFGICLPFSAAADPNTPLTYLTDNNGKAIALDTHRDRLYIGLNTGANNVRYLVLDTLGDTTTTWGQFPLGGNTQALSLDAERNRLYVANNNSGDSANDVYYCTLNDDGDITGGTGFNASNYGALALALDAERDRLYVAVADTTWGLIVCTLNSSGDISSREPVNTNQQANVLALDAKRNKLYLGYNSGKVGTINLNGAGDYSSLGSVVQIPETTNITSLALDSTRNRLYAGSAGDNNIYTFDLNNSGEIQDSPDIYPMGTWIHCLTLDATRGRLYVGAQSAGSNDLRWVDLDANGYPESDANTSGVSLSAIALDAKRQRLYTASLTNNQYYQLTDEPMTALWINDGSDTTSDPKVELHWSLPNAHFVKVSRYASNLDSYNFPNTYTANAVFDYWISAGDERWCNDAGVRANTLTVKAVLSGSAGVKNVAIWFWEDAGAGNGGGVMHYEEASINLLGLGDTPTNTPTFTLTPTNTPSI
ncbi:hypothetical protein KAR34_11050, partial [bacterium]|nr:hypothetical protein [bacterium]